MGGDALAASGKSQSLLGSGFDTDLIYRYVQINRNVFPHPLDIGRQLRALSQDGNIHISHCIARPSQVNSHHPQQRAAVCPPPAFIAVRKQFSNVPQSGGPQKGIHQRVEGHICVGVSQQTQVIGDLNTPQDQRPALHQTVHIISMANPRQFHSLISLLDKIASAKIISSGVVILIFS